MSTAPISWQVGAATVLVSGLMLFMAGCKSPPPDDHEPVVREAPKAAPQVPVDHVAKDSLVAGTEKAYAVVLPLGFAVKASVEQTRVAMGAATAKQVVTYLKEQVRDGKVLEGPERTVFKGVRIPAEPDRYLEIVVTERSDTVLIAVTDVTPLPPLPPATQDERYKQVGLDPRGRLLHPHTIE